MLAQRLITATAIILPLLSIFWLDVHVNFGFPGIWLLLVAAIAGLCIASELTSLLLDRTPGVTGWVVYCGTLLSISSVTIPEALQLPADCPVGRWGWSSLALGLTFLAACLAELSSFDEDRQSSIRIALTMLCVMYAGWLLSFLLALRLFLGNEWGALASFSVLFVVKMSDVGAYLVGKQFGRRKLAPRLSPGKTIEGVVGGLVAAVAAGLLFFYWIVPIWMPSSPSAPWWAVLGYALSLAALGVFGDLFESLIKRDMGRKDSSRWLPGLGGIMDMSDSVLVAAPLAFFWWTTGWLGGVTVLVTPVIP